MSTLYEYYNTNDDDRCNISGISWRAQTFTPSVAHKITSVKLLLLRLNLPGTITVSIQGVDGSDHPDGVDLCSGTTDGDTLTIDEAGEWREITLGAGYNLDADVKYAIVVKALDAGGVNRLRWRFDGTSPTYAEGCYEETPDGGSNWNLQAFDLMFEDWGEALGWTGKISGVTNPAKVMGVDVANIAKVKGVVSA